MHPYVPMLLTIDAGNVRQLIAYLIIYFHRLFSSQVAVLAKFHQEKKHQEYQVNSMSCGYTTQ